MQQVEIGADELREAVGLLRGGLTPQGVTDLSDLLARGFDGETAFDLYRKLFAPAEPLLDGARHVFVVPDDALQSLPLGVPLNLAPAALQSGKGQQQLGKRQSAVGISVGDGGATQKAYPTDGPFLVGGARRRNRSRQCWGRRGGAHADLGTASVAARRDGAATAGAFAEIVYRHTQHQQAQT